MSLERINRIPKKISNATIHRTFTDGGINLPVKERAMYGVFGRLFKMKGMSATTVGSNKQSEDLKINN